MTVDFGNTYIPFRADFDYWSNVKRQKCIVVKKIKEKIT